MKLLTLHSRIIICITIILFMYTACVPAVTLTGTWSNPSETPARFSNIMVVAMGKDLAKRKLGEDMLAREFNEAGIHAATSLDVFTPAFATSFDSSVINQQLLDKKFDAVITIRVVRVDEYQRWTPGYATPYAYGGFYRYYYRYGVYDYGRVTTEVQVLLESNLYDVKSGKLLWTGQSVSVSRNPTQQMAKQYAKNVVGDLLNKKIIVI